MSGWVGGWVGGLTLPFELLESVQEGMPPIRLVGEALAELLDKRSFIHPPTHPPTHPYRSSFEPPALPLLIHPPTHHPPTHLSNSCKALRKVWHRSGSSANRSHTFWTKDMATLRPSSFSGVGRWVVEGLPPPPPPPPPSFSPPVGLVLSVLLGGWGCLVEEEEGGGGEGWVGGSGLPPPVMAGRK